MSDLEEEGSFLPSGFAPEVPGADSLSEPSPELFLCWNQVLMISLVVGVAEEFGALCFDDPVDSELSVSQGGS